MHIAICGSMVFTDKMIEVKEILEQHGHSVIISPRAQRYAKKSAHQIEQISTKDKLEHDAIREYLDIIKCCDAILVLNYNKRGIKNYIGGNTLIEIGFAHYWKKKIFLLNPIPDISYYKSEIEATKPIILNGHLENLS